MVSNAEQPANTNSVGENNMHGTLGTGRYYPPIMAFDVYSIPLGPWQTNALVLQSTNQEVTICDPGMDPAPLLDHLQQHGLLVKQIILTHAHVDHIAGIDAVSHCFDDPPILVHPEEQQWLNQPELNLSSLSGFDVTTRPATGTIVDGQSISVGVEEAEVWHLPGHSPGSIGLYFQTKNILIGGDTLFQGSIGRTDFPTSEPEAMEASLRRLLTLPDETRVYPGHGPSTTIGQERQTNPFLRALVEAS